MDCFEDLFVVPDHRSDGTMLSLILAVQTEAKAQGWHTVRWIVCNHNYRTRSLHDKLAEKTDWTLYEMTEVAAK